MFGQGKINRKLVLKLLQPYNSMKKYYKSIIKATTRWCNKLSVFYMA